MSIAVNRPTFRHLLFCSPLFFTPLFNGCDQPTADKQHDKSEVIKQKDSNDPATLPWFEDISDTAGINFVHRSGHDKKYYMPEIMGGGAALFDMENDGDLDAYIVQSGSLINDISAQPVNKLYNNAGDGTFRDVTTGSGADDTGYGMGVASADYDNDGDTDLYVTNVGANVLLQNNGQGRFTDVTQTANVGDAGWGTSAAFFDADNDGDLDLFVLNYLIWSTDIETDCYSNLGTADYCSPQNYNAPARDVFYLNNGDGTFTEATEQAGFTKPGTGLGLVCGDFNADGWQDVFVANDGMNDRLWLNQKNGTFLESALVAGCAVDADGKAKAGMGVAANDLDDDGDLDLLVCNLNKETDSLYVNQGDYFIDRTAAAGLAVSSRPFTRFGMGWLDFNNDGYLDIYQANGRVMRQSKGYSEDPFAEPNLLMVGVEGSRFEEHLPRGGTENELIATSRAAAFGDIDNDGGVDILVVNRDATPHLLRNVIANNAHWIAFRVLNSHGGDAIGATLSLTLGNRTITRDVRPSYSYLASNDPRIHIGLGSESSIAEVEVKWVNGITETFRGIKIDQVVKLRTGEGVRSDE